MRTSQALWECKQTIYGCLIFILVCLGKSMGYLALRFVCRNAACPACSSLPHAFCTSFGILRDQRFLAMAEHVETQEPVAAIIQGQGELTLEESRNTHVLLRAYMGCSRRICPFEKCRNPAGCSWKVWSVIRAIKFASVNLQEVSSLTMYICVYTV